MWKRGCIKMTIEWLAGNRLRGTTAEKPALGLASGSVGGWVEVGRTTFGGGGSSISVTGIADKRYYMILNDTVQVGAGDHYLQFNGDTGSNYSGRRSANGATDTTATSTSEFEANDQTNGSGNLGVSYWSNLATKEKLGLGHFVSGSTAGAGTAPYRSEFAMKWANTSTAISSYQHKANSNFSSGSEVVVLGWDPADTHTTNFWEELASVELGTTANNIDSGTISAKKYLWVQCFIESSGGATNAAVQFNGDTANNYSERLSANGGADSTATAAASLSSFSTGAADENGFLNFFVINNSANEKLCLGGNVSVSTTGAGTAPDRREGVGKWANTSAQITSINISEQSAGIYGAKTFLKVWGSN